MDSFRHRAAHQAAAWPASGWQPNRQGRGRRRGCQGKGPDDLVLTSPGGAVLRSGNFRRRVFDPAARAAGLEDLSPHDLRRTAASLAVSSGANVKAVQRLLGDTPPRR